MAMPDLHWLERYAAHCGFHTQGADTLLKDLRSAFGAAAWRIVCRSPKTCFAPILRHRELSIHSLITYCKRLAERSFVQAPKPLLLEYFVRQRRLYFDRPCRIPQGEDFDLMRVANRHELLRLRDIATVANWAHQTRTCLQPAHRWSNLVMRARKHNERERVHLQSAKSQPWHFFCASMAWRGYQVEPLLDMAALWQEGQRHGNCLYKLRYDCTATKPSRFFRVSQNGRSIATLELAWRPPEQDFVGMDRVWGRWELQDLRLSYNRLPEPLLIESMRAFASMYNAWAKRLPRMPGGYVKGTYERIARVSRISVWSRFMAEEQTSV